MTKPFETLTLSVGDQAIAGIRRRAPDADAQRLLCLHGWLDNAASFLPLMPCLPALDIVAIDLPGHGYSSHASHGYSFFESALLARRIIDALGWSSCHVVGHSMGAGIAPMLAVAAPAVVERLILIEGLGPLSEEAGQLPERLVRAFDDRLTPERFASRTFASQDDAIEARLKATRMERASAKLIIDRQLVEQDGGWRWRFDPALRSASARYSTEAQVEAILGAIDVPVLTVIADEGFIAGRPQTATRLANVRNHESMTLRGHHHVHMDTPEPVASAINRFLSTPPDSGG